MKRIVIDYLCLAISTSLLLVVLWNYMGMESYIEEIETEEEYRFAQKEEEWKLMLLAIMKTESNFKEDAIGSGEAIGILQITPIYVEEVNRIIGEEKYEHKDALSMEKSVEMFNIYQGAKNKDKNIDKAIRLHNPTAGDWYMERVKNNMRYLKKIRTAYNVIS